jgi:hypothetical protein
VTPRQNAEGLWRCTRCKVYLPASAFYVERTKKLTPVSRCKPCNAASYRAWFNRKALADDAWYARHVRLKAKWDARVKVHSDRMERERGEMSRVLLADIIARGLTPKHVTEITGVHWDTQQRIKHEGRVRHRDVLERLVTLQQIVRQVPAYERKRGTPHPHLGAIARRYQALRAAHAA